MSVLGCSVSLGSFSGCVLLLAHKSDRKLANVNRGVGTGMHVLLVNYIIDLLFFGIILN